MIAGASAAGVRRVAHDQIDSTNTEALRLARRGERGPLWVIATQQTAGRGRRGRIWISPPGNLYASLLLNDPAPVDRWPQLSFVTALAVRDAIADVAPDLLPALALKWPNDLLLGGAKLAGILIEGEPAPSPTVAIGIGVNCTSHPTDLDYPATDLAAAGRRTSADALLDVLSVKLLDRLAQWNQGTGFLEVRAAWLAGAAWLGAEIRVRAAGREITGRFEGLDENGCLVLAGSAGPEIVGAGDVLAQSLAPAPAAGTGAG